MNVLADMPPNVKNNKQQYGEQNDKSTENRQPKSPTS